MGDYEEKEFDELGNLKNSEIPFALKEFGEIPEGYVPVYVVVNKESLQWVADHGLRQQDSQMATKFPEISKIFDEVNQEWSKPVDRAKCVFAYFKHPDKVEEGLGFESKDDRLIEVMIDPKNVRTYVAEGTIFTEANTESFRREEKDEEWRNSMREHADDYWRSAMHYEEYKKKVEGGKMVEYRFPEVLIQEDVPTSRMRVVQ